MTRPTYDGFPVSRPLGVALAGLIAMILLGAAPQPGLATTTIPYPPAVREAVQETFLTEVSKDAPEQAMPNPGKVAAYRKHLRRKRSFIIEHVSDYRRQVKDQKKKKARKKAKKSDSARTLDLAADLLDQLEQSTDPAEIYRLGATVLTLDFATRNYNYPIGSVQMPNYIGNMMIDWSVDGRTRRGDGPEEASNLVDPATGAFYTGDEIDAMIEAGQDISRLDPPSDGLLWANPGDIGSIDIAARYFGGGDALHEGQKTPFPPDGQEFDFHKVRMSQTKPKIDVYWYDEACRARPEKDREDCWLKYKLKFGGETFSDPVANSLMSAVGYNVDVSYHIMQPRVKLGDTSYEEFRRDWENYFDQQQMWTRLNLSKAMLPGDDGLERKESSDTLIFVSAGIEAKPEDFLRVGGWSNGLIQRSSMATGMREARALAIFNVWIANTDLKDAENNKIILKKSPDGEWKLFMNQQDAGNSMGLILAEKVDAFPWEAVETSFWSRGFGAMRGRIELNYFAVQSTGVYDTATYADHRWMVRKIAQLSREQIETAVGLGRWPGGIGQLYAEKLINRRNGLVEAFGLSDEFESIPVDKKLTTADGSVVNGSAKISQFPEETPVDLSNHWKDLARPMGPLLWRSLRRIVAVAIGSIDSFSGEITVSRGDNFFSDTDDLLVVPELLISLSRDVVANPAPKSGLDQYVVEDYMKIGVRVGVGTFIQGRATVEREYRLAYGVPSDWQGKLYNNQALNWFLPLNARRGKVPDRFVLLRESAVGPGITLRSPDPSDTVTGGADVGLDYLHSWRTVVDRRPEGAALWREQGDAAVGDARVWLKIYPLRITFWKGSLAAGRNKGDVFVLPRKEGEEPPLDHDDDVDAVVASLLKGDRGPMEASDRTRGRKTDSIYSTVWQEANLWVVKWASRARLDRVKLASSEGEPIGTQHQSNLNKTFSWKILDNGESYTCSVAGYLDTPVAPEGASEEEEQLADGDHWGDSRPVLVSSVLVDDMNTHSDEMNQYHRYMQSLGGGKKYLAKKFDAQEWEQSGKKGGRWGRVLAQGQLVLRKDALDALVDIDRDKFWKKLGRRLDLDAQELARARREMRATPKRRLLSHRRIPVAARGPIRSAQRTMSALSRAQNATKQRRLAHLTRAVGSSGCIYGEGRAGEVMKLLMHEIDLRKLAKHEQGSVRTRITRPINKENNFPEGKDFVGRIGKVHLPNQIDIISDPFDPIELHDMMDWAYGVPKRGYVTPSVLLKYEEE